MVQRHLRQPFVIILFGLLALGGCRTATIGGSKGMSAANDDLRTRITALESENKRLRASLDEARATLEEEQRVRQGLVSADVLNALPRCAGIELDRLTGAVPADRWSPAEKFILYVEPYDGRRRFIQAVGTIRADVLELPAAAATSGDAPRIIASAVLGPDQVRESYRSGFTGTHYAIEIPLDADQGVRIRTAPLLVRVQYEDALSGRVHEAAMTLPPATPAR